MPGTPGGYNPGGGGGYGTYPWLSFIMLPGGLYGAKLAKPLVKPVAGLLLSPVRGGFQRGIPTPGGLGLYQHYGKLGDLRTVTDILNLGRLISSGGGGPGESPTSTDSPRGLHQQGQPVPVVVPAASISAHGGGRSGAKPRSQRYTHMSIRGKHPKCPPGYVWSYKKKRCVHVHGRERRYFRKG